MSAKKIRTGLGIVARNWKEELVEVRVVQELKKGRAIVEEAVAIKQALLMAKDAG